MLFSNSKNINHGSLKIYSENNTTIERVQRYKYLGIWVEKITFKNPHWHFVIKAKTKIGFLFKNKTCFPLFTRKRIVEAVFLSLLDYGAVIYGRAASSALKPLDAVYHFFFKFITGYSYGTHHCLLYQKTGLPAVSVRSEQHLYIYPYKTILQKLPLYLSSLLSWNVSVHGMLVALSHGSPCRCQKLKLSWEKLLSVFGLHMLGIVFSK